MVESGTSNSNDSFKKKVPLDLEEKLIRFCHLNGGYFEYIFLNTPEFFKLPQEIIEKLEVFDKVFNMTFNHIKYKLCTDIDFRSNFKNNKAIVLNIKNYPDLYQQIDEIIKTYKNLNFQRNLKQ